MKALYDHDRLTSEWCSIWSTIDWQVKVQYDENRLISENATTRQR